MTRVRGASALSVASAATRRRGGQRRSNRLNRRGSPGIRRREWCWRRREAVRPHCERIEGRSPPLRRPRRSGWIDATTSRCARASCRSDFERTPGRVRELKRRHC
eukprot:6181839-Pleurochrysis_carterae.AAC.2